MKEYYFHVDNTPTHSYMALLYKYPQAAFPYRELIDENRRRNGQGPEFELLDTGIFDDDRYFDILIEYAKADAEDICDPHHARPIAVPTPRRCTSCRSCGFATRGRGARSRGPSRDHVAERRPRARRSSPTTRDVHADPHIPPSTTGSARASSTRPRGGRRSSPTTRRNGAARLRPRQHESHAVHQGRVPPRVCEGERLRAIRPSAARRPPCTTATIVPAGGPVTLHLRLTDGADATRSPTSTRSSTQRKREADEFYDALHPPGATADEKLVQRQALAGLLWTKQSYIFDVATLARRRQPRLPAAGVSARRSATRTGATSTRCA